MKDWVVIFDINCGQFDVEWCQDAPPETYEEAVAHAMRLRMEGWTVKVVPVGSELHEEARDNNEKYEGP